MLEPSLPIPATERPAAHASDSDRASEAAHLASAHHHHYLTAPAALIPGNSVRILHDGAEAYPRMLAAIAAATRTVRLEIYHLADDLTGRTFGKALIEAAARGVEVRVLCDGIGMFHTPRAFLRWLQAGGVQVRVTRLMWRLFQLRSDHRKLLVVDGERAFVGGMNIADAWAPRENGHAWRDMMVELEGPAAKSLEGVFRASWRAQQFERFALRHKPACKGEVSLAILAARQAIHRAYVHAIERARRSVVIAAGYFVPDAVLLGAIQRATERGVEVSIILPGKSDHPLIQAAGRAFYDRLLSWNVRIYEWWDAMLHAKGAVVDQVWATVGSFNLDSLSRRYNFELNVVLADPALGQGLHEKLSQDVTRSVQVMRETWSRRAWHRKVTEGICYLLRRWL